MDLKLISPDRNGGEETRDARTGHGGRDPKYGGTMTSATRSLCTGAYLDHKFRTRVLREVYSEGRRALAPSYGFDAIPVLLHCRRARDWIVARDILLCACLGLSLLTGTLNTGGVALLLILWAVATSMGWLIRVAVGFDRERRVSARAQAIFGFAGFSTLLIWVLASALPGTLEILMQLSNEILLTGEIPQPWFGLGELNPPSNTAISVVVLLMFAVAAMEALQRQMSLERLMQDNPWRSGLRRRRLATFAECQAGNVTMYSGFSPFIGAGQELRTWSFALRMVRASQSSWFAQGGRARPPSAGEAADGHDELLFKVDDLIAHLREQLGALAIKSEPRLALPGLTIRDHVFQASEGAGRLTHTMDPATVSDIIADPTRAARHYLTCQVRSWDGEVVTTVFVHVALQGRTLYLEFSAWMLPPTRVEYQLLRDPRNTEPGARLDAVGRALITLPRRATGPLPGCHAAAGRGGRTGPGSVRRHSVSAVSASSSPSNSTNTAAWSRSAMPSVTASAAVALPATDTNVCARRRGIERCCSSDRAVTPSASSCWVARTSSRSEVGVR
jgi:hypothetical protein